jgi:hypothetical protein
VTTIGDNNNNNGCCNIRHTVACLPSGMASTSECEKQQTSHKNKFHPALSIHTFDPPDNEHKHTQGSLRLSNNSLNCKKYEAVTTKSNGLSSPNYRQIRTALAQSRPDAQVIACIA